MKCNARQAGAFVECKPLDAGNAVRDRDALQAGAAVEGLIPDAFDAIRNRDARQGCAAIEGEIPDASNAITNRDARQAFAAIEGASPDAGNAVRDRVIVTCLASRMIKQHRLFFIEQNPIDIRVIHVPPANRNRRQAGAVTEGASPDAGDTIGNRDARQAGAGLEGFVPDAGDRFIFNGVWND